MFGSISVIKGLLPVEQTKLSCSPALCASLLYSNRRFRSETFTENELQILLSNGFIDWVADDFVGFELRDLSKWQDNANAGILASCPPNESFFETQVRSYFPRWDQYCKSDKVRMVSSSMSPHWTAERLRRLLDLEMPLQREHIRAWETDGVSLLHWSIMWFSDSEPLLESRRQRKNWTEWLKLLTELISATDNLHSMRTYQWRRIWDPPAKENKPTTFLLCLFRIVDRRLDGSRDSSRVEIKLSLLLDVLMSCGVDLEEYGRREFDIWEREHGAKHLRSVSCVKIVDWNWTMSRHLGYTYGSNAGWTHELMVAIHYGPKPEDWFIEWDRNWDYAEVFWKMVENPLEVEVMPGSWVDDEPSKFAGRPPYSSFPWLPAMC